MDIIDKALWITWYDLPADGRDAYLAWMHERYLPELLARPGYLSASHFAAVDKNARQTNARDARNNTDDPAVPRGDRYIVVVGAGDANAFGDPTPTALHAALPAASKRMLAMRTGERMSIMVESARVEGPGAKTHESGMTLAPCIQVGAYNCPWQNEEEIARVLCAVAYAGPWAEHQVACASASSLQSMAGRSMACCTSLRRSKRATSISSRTKTAVPTSKHGGTRSRKH